MALAGSVSGDGTLIASSSGPGSYTQSFVTVSSDGTEKTTTVTTSYTETRTTHKWYALTEAAVTTYQASNPTKRCNGTLVNDVVGGWELEVETVTRSNIYIDITIRTATPA